MVLEALFRYHDAQGHGKEVEVGEWQHDGMMVEEVEVTSTAGRSISWAERSSLAGSEQ